MRLWIEFEKQKELRFLSHLDMMRTWQRAIRRARLPVAFSQGFNPQQRVSFASALPVGVASVAEYVEIYFREEVTGDDILKMGQTLPPGLSILSFREVPPAAPSLMSLVGAEKWVFPLNEHCLSTVENTLSRVLDSPALPVIRTGKKGPKTIDIRPYIIDLSVTCVTGEKVVEMFLKSGSSGGAKPKEVLEILEIDPGRAGAILTKTHLYLKINNRLQAPMDVLFDKNGVLIDAQKDYYQL